MKKALIFIFSTFWMVQSVAAGSARDNKIAQNEVPAKVGKKQQALPEEGTTQPSASQGAETKTAQPDASHKDYEALKEGLSETTEYTIDPSSVELIVELDPKNYGFRTRNHRMTLSVEIDPILRGRGMLHYDYRFFNYLSVGIVAGVDSTSLSLYSQFRDALNKPAPWQFSVLGGLSARWRLTEWYMRSAFFLEPSFLVGYMWQRLLTQNSTHWRLRPGLFGCVETVFDSGLSLSTRVGMEFPLDFMEANPVKQIIEPLIMVGFGLAF